MFIRIDTRAELKSTFKDYKSQDEFTHENVIKLRNEIGKKYIYGDPEDDFGGSHLKRVMPNFGEGMALDLVPVDLDGQLTPTPRVLAGLLVYLESIQR